MLHKKKKYVICVLTVIEVLLICTESIKLLLLCLIGNHLVFGICCISSTIEFINLLRSKNNLLYYKHQGAMNSYNILTIKIALRKEDLNEEESRGMKKALQYIWYSFYLNIILVIVFIFQNFI